MSGISLRKLSVPSSSGMNLSISTGPRPLEGAAGIMTGASPSLLFRTSCLAAEDPELFDEYYR